MTLASYYLLLIKSLIKYIVENNLVLLSLVYFVKVNNHRAVIDFLQIVRTVRGLFLLS